MLSKAQSQLSTMGEKHHANFRNCWRKKPTLMLKCLRYVINVRIQGHFQVLLYVLIIQFVIVTLKYVD